MNYEGVKIADSVLEELVREKNYQDFFELSPPEVFSSIPAEKWIVMRFADADRGFRPEGRWHRFRRRIIQFFIQFCEDLVGAKLYVRPPAWDEAEIEPRFKKIVKELTASGVITGAFRGRFRPDWPKLPFYRVPLGPIPKAVGDPIFLVGTPSGIGLNSNQALATAIAEALERHALCSWDYRRIVRGSFKEMRNRGAVDPAVFRCFSDEQLRDPAHRKRHCFDHSTRFDWIGADALISGEKRLIPAQLAHIGYEPLGWEPKIRAVSSSGAGAGDSFARAAYSAICENLERDGLMIFWLNKIAPPRIDPATIASAAIHDILARYARCGIETAILDITTDIGVPSFAVVTLDCRRGGSGVLLTCATDLDPEHAILHALCENIKIAQAGLSQFNETNFAKVRKEYPMLRSLTSRWLWWGQPEAVREAEWFVRGPQKALRYDAKPPTEYADKLAALKALLSSQGKEAYLVSLSSPFTRRYGLHVAMSLIPGLYPLYLNEEHKYLGVDRLYTVPVKLGYLAKPRLPEEINEVPHPMA